MNSISSLDHSENKMDVAIIGAGLTGLCVGWELKQSHPNKNTQIFEKSRAVGGRLATRRLEGFTFDHGAQFIKRNKDTESWIEKGEGIVEKMITGDFEAFCFREGMTKFAKILAQPQKIHFDHKLLAVKNERGLWSLEFENASTLSTQSLILTAPLPQTHEILQNSGIAVPRELAEINYHKALVLLLGLQEARELEFPYQEKITAEIFSVCDQEKKGTSVKPGWTVVMTSEWSEEHFNLTDEEILKKALEQINNTFPGLKIAQSQLKRWRYAQPRSVASQLFSQPAENLYLGGDAFGGPSLSGAIRSAKALLKHIGLSMK